MFALINGEIKKRQDVYIDPSDLGFARGFGVFAYMRTYNNHIPYLQKHIQGLINSAQAIGLQHKYDIQFLIDQVIYILDYNNIHFQDVEKSIKIILTGGISNGMRQENITNPTLLVIVDKFIPFANELYQNGISLKTFEYQRDYPESKTLSYIHGVKLLSDSHNDSHNSQLSIFEPLYIDTNTKDILETSNGNFFFIKEGIIYTQKSNIFRGVVRDLILNEFGYILKNKNIVKDIIETEDIFLKDIDNINLDKKDSNIEAIFITGAAKEIMPVKQIIDENNKNIYCVVDKIYDNTVIQNIINEWGDWIKIQGDIK